MTHPPGAAGTNALLDAVRAAEFPWEETGATAYLNHASTGPLPLRAVRALHAWDELRAEPWRISQAMQFGTLARARVLCARLVGAAPDEIALMVNTSYGINFAARALPLAPGDVVLSGDREFPANVYPWMALERARGVTFRQVPCAGRLADEEAVLRALDGDRVRVLTLSWVSFETGMRLDLARLGAACRERGITFVVDAIQGVGAAPIDVHACHVDILACGAQKWLLGPWGTGFLFVRRELVHVLEPQAVGWMSVRNAEDFSRQCAYDLTWLDDARRFEVITLPFQEFAGLNASLELFLEVGLDVVFGAVRARARELVEWARRSRRVRLVTPPELERLAGIVSVIPDDPEDASRRLGAAGVVHSLREGAIRLSPHFHTPAAQVERAMAILDA
jgi:cysteine desulfurase/selenocysteine lyase